MDVETYISSEMAGFEFLIALGSLIGLFELVMGALLLFFGGRSFKSKGLKILLIIETKYFATFLEDQMALSSLGYRQACIINTVQKERFLFYTPDFVSLK